MMKINKERHQIVCFEYNDLIYKAYIYKDGELVFSVTGDEYQLGLLDKDDPLWRDFEPPTILEMTRLIEGLQQPIAVIRKIARHIAQYLERHQPVYIYFQLFDDPRRYSFYMRLLRRYPQLLKKYDLYTDEAKETVMLIKKH